MWGEGDSYWGLDAQVCMLGLGDRILVIMVSYVSLLTEEPLTKLEVAVCGGRG